MLTVKAYAAPSPSEPLVKTTITRRAVAPHDVLIKLHYTGICHSDIHTVRGEWGPQTYPLAEPLAGGQLTPRAPGRRNLRETVRCSRDSRRTQLPICGNPLHLFRDRRRAHTWSAPRTRRCMAHTARRNVGCYSALGL